MNTRPASVHFLAKAEFSLNCQSISNSPWYETHATTYEAIPWMYACTAMQFSGFNNLISVKISRRIPEVDSKR